MFWKHQNKIRKCRTLNILGHLFSEVPLHCWLHTHNHLNGANQQGGNMTSASWLAIRLSIRHIYSPSTATEEHTELSLLPRDRKTRRRKKRDGLLDSLELVFVIEARKGCNIAFLSAWAGSKQLLISFLFFLAQLLIRCLHHLRLRVGITWWELKDITGASCKQTQHQTMALEWNKVKWIKTES